MAVFKFIGKILVVVIVVKHGTVKHFAAFFSV